MTRIGVYDTDAERLERISDTYDTTVAELVQLLLDEMEDADVDTVMEQYGFSKR